MGQLNDILSKASDIVWGIPLLVLLVGTGLYLTIRLGFLQFHSMGYALKLSFSKGKQDKKSDGDISHYQALTTAMAATMVPVTLPGLLQLSCLGDQVLFSGCGSRH